MNRKSQRQSNARDTGDSPIIPEKIRRESSAQPNANSNIVHVNTGALEMYLQTLKKTVSRHEEELLHPTWWDSIKKEVDKIAPMGRKLDHTQLDVAVIRDHIMALPSNASDGSDEESINNVVAYIKKELEGLRILSRRIELHQAAEISALKEVSEMKNNINNINQQMNEDNTSERVDELSMQLNQISNNMSSHIEELSSDLKELDATHLSKIKEVGSTVITLKNTIDNEFSMVLSDTARIKSKLEGENDPTSAKGREFRSKLKEVIETVGSGRLNNKLNLAMGLMKIQNAVRIRKNWEIRICFMTWKRMHGNFPAGGGGGGSGGNMYGGGHMFGGFGTVQHPIHGKNGMTFIDRTHPELEKRHNSIRDLFMGVSSKCYEQYAAHQQMNALQLWRQNCENRVIWGRLKSRFAPVLTYWYRRVKPNMRLYLHRWRLKVLLMRKGLETINKSDAFARLNPSLMLTYMDSENMSHQALIMQEALSKLSINQRYGGLVGDVNDGLSQLQNATWIVSNYLGKLSKKTVEVETVSKSNKKDIQLNRDKIEKVHTDMSNMIRSRFEVSEKALVAYKGQVTQRFVMTKHDVDKAAELQMSKNIEMDARSTKIEERLDLLEARSVTTDAKLDRILLLQGNLLDRLQSIETRVDRVEQKNNVRDLEVAQALKSAAEAVEEVSNSKAQVKDSFSYFDDEVKYLKVYSRRINEDLKQFMGLFTEQSGKSKGVAKELKKRLDSLTEIVDLNVDGDPTPEELYQIYMSYEECVVKSQHKGKTSTAFPKDIAITLSKYAYRLAAFVAREVELDMLFGVISGPQPPPATSAAHHPAGAGVGSGVPIPESTPEEDVLRNREIFLQKFNNSYLELFTVVAHHLGAQTGIARSEARAVFHRRFIAAVESALSKHDVLVMETAPSLIGKSNKDSKNATCVSCDRPLNAPRYKSNKSWQQALLLHQMPNGHPATGLADKKAAESPQKMRPKSAQPISSASPSTLVALSSIQKSMGTDFGMPASKTEDIPIAEVPDLGPTHRIPMVAVGTIEESSIEGHVENIAIASKYDDDIPESQKAESLTANNESLASAMLTLRSRSPIADERKAESRFVLDDGGGANAMVRSSSAKSTNRPASATSRHKTAIQDAYVLRGGFKMKVQKPQNNQNSDVFADVRNSQSTPSLNPYDATKGTLNTNPSNAPKSSIQTSSNPNLSASGVGVQ